MAMRALGFERRERPAGVAGTLASQGFKPITREDLEERRTRPGDEPAENPRHLPATPPRRTRGAPPRERVPVGQGSRAQDARCR